MKIDLTKDEWDVLKESLDFINYKCIANFNQDKILGKILEKLGSEWVDDECNATLPCGYENGKEPRFTYD